MYEQLKIPKTCSVDKTIFKKMFLENGDLSAADKKSIFRYDRKSDLEVFLKKQITII